MSSQRTGIVGPRGAVVRGHQVVLTAVKRWGQAEKNTSRSEQIWRMCRQGVSLDKLNIKLWCAFRLFKGWLQVGIGIPDVCFCFMLILGDFFLYSLWSQPLWSAVLLFCSRSFQHSDSDAMSKAPCLFQGSTHFNSPFWIQRFFFVHVLRSRDPGSVQPPLVQRLVPICSTMFHWSNPDQLPHLFFLDSCRTHIFLLPGEHIGRWQTRVRETLRRRLTTSEMVSAPEQDF